MQWCGTEPTASLKYAYKQKDILCSWAVRLNIVKVSTDPKWATDPTQSRSEFQLPFYGEVEKPNFKRKFEVYGIAKDPKTILKKKNRVYPTGKRTFSSTNGTGTTA